MSSRWRSSSTSESGRLLAAFVVAFAAAVAGCSMFDVFHGTPPDATPSPTAAAVVADKKPAAPAAPSRIAFNHKFHLERGPTCEDCHKDVEKSDKAPMPTLDACSECHEEIDAKKPKEKTLAAFLDKPGGTPAWSHVTAQVPDIAFSHKAHLAKKLECADCHKGIKDSSAVTKDLFVDMDACVNCHQAKAAKTDCATCHKAAAKSVAEGHGPFFKPANHDDAWRGRHGPVSRAAPAGRADKCDDCHGKPQFPEKANCVVCHTQTKPASHDKAWNAMHGQTVRSGPDAVAGKCAACHDLPAFPTESRCVVCHTQTKPASHEKIWTAMHGQTVRRDPGLVSGKCAACHDLPDFPSQSRCSGCHATEPPRDHSQSWRVGGGHGLAAAMDRTRCDACHTPDTCASCHQQIAPRSHRGGWGEPRDGHCVGCHLPLTQNEPGGCGVCHLGTPSHDAAPKKPSWHRQDFQCSLCHQRLRHVTNGTNCNTCHR